MDSQAFIDGKNKEEVAISFLSGVLKRSGYEVMKYGIENHNQEIIGKLRGKVDFETNKRLLTMPDLVVFDNETNEAWLVEVKCKFSDKLTYFQKNLSMAMTYHHLKNYIEYWNDTTIIFVFKFPPYFKCVDVKDIDWNRHFIEKKQFKNSKTTDEIWNFYDIYKDLTDKFPKVTSETIKHALGNQLLKK
jgi:hypothetical protein